MLTQGSKLEMVNLVFSSSTIFYTGTIKLHKGVIKQLDKYRKHCSKLSSKKPSKAASPMVSIPKKQEGLGAMNLNTHNEAMLLKFLHKIFTIDDIPCVNLVWDNYYVNGRLPGQNKKGSFWWRDIIKLLEKFKNMVRVIVGDGSTVSLWDDVWNGVVPAQAFSELYSFANIKRVTFKSAISGSDFIRKFNIPLSFQAFQQVSELKQLIDSKPTLNGSDIWSYSWGNAIFSMSKAYKALIGNISTHPAFLWIWRSKCQMKHKVLLAAVEG